jgi:ABC-type lipoprotein release transport system permease subunit
MISFLFGVLLGYVLGTVVAFYVNKIDREIKDGRR